MYPSWSNSYVVLNLVIPTGADSASYHLKRLGTDALYKWLVLRRCIPQGLQLPSQVASLEILHWLISKKKKGGLNILHFQSANFLRDISTLSPQRHDKETLDG
jgi:hypothetical protein